MNIIPGRKIRADLKAYRGETEKLRKEVSDLNAFILDDIDRATESTRKYQGNEYKEYAAIIKALAEKYQGKADWGCQPTGNIVDVRSSFIIGQGVNVSPVDPKDAESEEMKFCNAFFDYNDLDREMVQEFAKEAEIEGCFLGTLRWINNEDPDDDPKKEGMVSLQFMSRVETNYKIVHPKDDYTWYQAVTWNEGSEPKKLKEGEFIYARFGGRVHKPNEPTPKIGKCLTEIEALSQALRDWREINNLFAAPIPHIECENADQAKYMAAELAKVAKNWKLRKLFAHTGKLGYATPTELTALENEIITLAKIISGATGVPVHFLGLPDLMSNRSTAENLMELVSASTSKERLIWQGTYQQIIAKAMMIRNKNSNFTALDPSKIKVTIPYVSQEMWNRLTSVYLLLFNSNALSLETLLNNVPGINVTEEMERIKVQKEENAENFMNSAFKSQDDDEEDNGDNTDEEK